jgi:simple sugar transport system permease protein
MVASRFAGISVGRSTLISLSLSGATAGLVGVNEVMGYGHRVVEGFSPGYGFTGIAVALLARNHPIGILLSAFLFGALQNASRELEFLSDKVSKELALCLQGTLIAFIACDHLISKLFAGPKGKEKK